MRPLITKLPDGTCRELALFKRAPAQQKNSKHKVYSLHEPAVYCKAHKKYEYGCNASVVLTQKASIIVGTMTFKTNVYDRHQKAKGKFA